MRYDRNDLAGAVFGRLTAISFSHVGKYGELYWLCKCICGTEKVIKKYSITSGITRSCGCLLKDNAKIRPNALSHGLAKRGGHHRLYNIWNLMLARCNKPKNRAYKNYGGRGIRVCKEWEEDIKTFYDWSMESGYADNLSIDRIDNNGNYEPANCRWVDARTQTRNMRVNRLIEYNGEIKTLAEWSEITKIPRSTIARRLLTGCSVEFAFRPVWKKGMPGRYSKEGNRNQAISLG